MQVLLVGLDVVLVGEDVVEGDVVVSLGVDPAVDVLVGVEVAEAVSVAAGVVGSGDGDVVPRHRLA